MKKLKRNQEASKIAWKNAVRSAIAVLGVKEVIDIVEKEAVVMAKELKDKNPDPTPQELAEVHALMDKIGFHTLMIAVSELQPEYDIEITISKDYPTIEPAINQLEEAIKA